MANCVNCGMKLISWTTGTALPGNDPSEKLCLRCQSKLYSLVDGKDITENYIKSHYYEFKEKGVSDEGIKQLEGLVTYRIKEKARKEQEETEKKIKEEARKITLANSSRIIVTTGDLKQDYEVIGPVYYQITNKGGGLSAVLKEYGEEIAQMREEGTMSEYIIDWGFLFGEWSAGQNYFESAFFIATQEIKKRAALLGGDAVICMRQDIDIDTNGFQYFYLQMYGTAVKFLK